MAQLVNSNSSSMRKTVLSTMLMISIIASYVCTASAHTPLTDEPTNKEVLDINGKNIRFGADNSFTIWNIDMLTGYVDFFFGLAFPGIEVRTDTEITMGFGNGSEIIACQADGSIVTVPVTSINTPLESMIRVRYHTDGFYRLQITNETPAVFVQVVPLSQGALRCTRGTEGSRLIFQLPATSTSHAHNAIGIPPHIVPQVSRA